MRARSLLMLAFGGLLLLPGCATVVSDRQYPVAIENSGAPTYFVVRDRKNEVVQQGVTPAQVTLDAKSAPFRPAKYDVTFIGAGENSQHHALKAKLDPWTAGNIVLGGGIGAVVDAATGAMWKLPAKVSGKVPAQFAVADRDQGARIAAMSSPEAPVSMEVTKADLQQVKYQASVDADTLTR